MKLVCEPRLLQQAANGFSHGAHCPGSMKLWGDGGSTSPPTVTWLVFNTHPGTCLLVPSGLSEVLLAVLQCGLKTEAGLRTWTWTWTSGRITFTFLWRIKYKTEETIDKKLINRNLLNWSIITFYWQLQIVKTDFTLFPFSDLIYYIKICLIN